MEELIQRILQKVGSVRETRTQHEVLAFGKRLELSLSPFFISLYTRVGDGGFGPGIAGIPSLATLEARLAEVRNDPDDDWPHRFVEFVGYGRSQCSGIDLGAPQNPVHYIDGDGGRGDLYDSVSAYHDSLDAYFSDWLKSHTSKK